MPLLRLALGRMGLSAEPKGMLASARIPLLNHQAFLYYPPSEEETERWLAKADMLAPALSLAVERWGELPGIKIVRDSGRPLAESEPGEAPC